MDVRKRRVSEICRRRCQRTEEDAVVLIGPMLDRGGGGWGSRVGGGTGLSWASRGESGWSWKGGGGDLGVCWGSMLGMTSGWDIQGPGDVVGGDGRGWVSLGATVHGVLWRDLGMGFWWFALFWGMGFGPSLQVRGRRGGHGMGMASVTSRLFPGQRGGFDGLNSTGLGRDSSLS